MAKVNNRAHSPFRLVFKEMTLWLNVINTKKSVLSDLQTPRSGLKRRGTAKFFLTNL